MIEEYVEGLDECYSDTWVRRDAALSKFGLTYKEFLASDHWLNVKIKAMKRSNYHKCTFCSNRKIELHHTSYKWLFTKDELRNVIALCREHHEEIHNYAKSHNMSVRIATNLLRSRYNSTDRSHLSRLGKYKKYFPVVLEEYNRLLNKLN